jgi:hypothetical protein
VRQTGRGSIPARLSASPNWLGLIDCSPITPARGGFVLVARVPLRHNTLFDVVRKFLAQHLPVPGHVDSSILLSGPPAMENSNGLAVQPVTAACPTPSDLISQMEIDEAFLLADYWYLQRAGHAMGLRYFDSVRRQRIVPFL